MNAHQSLLRFRSELEIRRANWSKSKLITLIVGIDLQCIHARCIGNIIIRIGCREQRIHLTSWFMSSVHSPVKVTPGKSYAHLSVYILLLLSLWASSLRVQLHIYMQNRILRVVFSLPLSVVMWFVGACARMLMAYICLLFQCMYLNTIRTFHLFKNFRRKNIPYLLPEAI